MIGRRGKDRSGSVAARWGGAVDTAPVGDDNQKLDRLNKALRPWEANGSTKPTPRGWPGAGGGRTFWREPVTEWRGTSVQVNGAFYPFGLSCGLPADGVPLGKAMTPTGDRVSCDPISWFLAGRILSPIMFILGLPGLGKTSLIRQIISVVPAWGVVPIVMSDTRPGTDFGPVTEAIGGYRVRIGPGVGSINPLDPGPLAPFLGQLPEEDLLEALADIRQSRINLVQGLLEIARGAGLRDAEKSLIAAGIDVLDQEHEGIPVIEDLIAVIESRHEKLRVLAFDRGQDDRYDDVSEGLLRTLGALGPSGPYGGVFSGQSSFTLDLSRPVCMDLSSIPQGADELMGAAQLASWSLMATSVAAARRLSEAGVIEKVTYLLIGDELHRPLKALPKTVLYVDVIIRLIRALNIGAIFCTHTMDDLRLNDPELRAKAWGFVEKSPLVAMGGLSRKEMGNLATVFDMTESEQDLLVGWTDQAASDPDSVIRQSPPGLGKFLLKQGRSPGIAFQTRLAQVVREVNDTNASWFAMRDRRFNSEGE